MVRSTLKLTPLILITACAVFAQDVTRKEADVTRAMIAAGEFLSVNVATLPIRISAGTGLLASAETGAERGIKLKMIIQTV